MFKSKSVLTMIITAVLLAGGVGTYCVVKNNDAKSSFTESGYIIDGTEDLEGGFAKYTFDAGTELEYCYPDNLKFKSTTDEEVVTDRNCFLHFNDGSLSSLSQGVLIDLNECETGVLNYYNLTAGATLENQGGSYALETKAASLHFKDFLWKIGDDKYMLTSDEIVITMADKQELEFSEYVELKYYNEGILLILSENGAYRTVSSECVATVENGIQIDLATRTVMAKETVLMSMEQMVIGADDNIDILSPIKAVKGEEKVKQEQMQIQIQMPTFEVIDGADGINGEQGIDGTKGKTGSEGAAGVNGMDGLVGADGLMGEDGFDGNQGDPGMPGTPGTAGGAGANGATGASGAQGLSGAAGQAGAQGIQGNDGLNGDDVIDGSAVPGGEEEKIQLPTFSLSGTEISSNEAKFFITVTEGNVTLPGVEDITVKILDNASGREVRRLKKSSADGSPIEVIVDGLAANTEYCLMVNASYIVKNGTYERTFLKKVFNTNAIGLTFVKNFILEDSLAFTVYKSSYSNVQSVSLALANETGVIKTIPIPAFDADGKAVVLFENEYGEITSNTLYQVYLCDVFDGVKTFNKIGVQEHRTLKKQPELGVPRVVVDKANAVFNMQLEGVKDEDNGIKFFRYELYPCYADGSVNTTNGPDKTMLISTNSVLACDVTQSMKNTTYRVRVVASFYDNEKTVEVASDDYSDPFAMMNIGFPLVTYKAKTEVDPGIPGDTAITRHDRLVGTIQIETNDTRIRVDEQHPITVYYKSGSGQIGQMAVTNMSSPNSFTGTDGNGTFNIPIDWSGLRASDNYVITVWAYTDLADNSGSASTPGSEFSNIQIGTIIARTNDPAAFQATFASNPTASVGFSMRLTDRNVTTSAAYESTTIDAIEVRIYSGDKTTENSTATLVASTILRAENDGNGLNSASQRNSTLGRDIYGDGTEIKLTEADFPNFNPSQIEGDQYTVEIAAVQDYTEYRNRFTVSNNMAVLTKAAVPPAWQDEWASNGFEIIEILNNRESLVGAGQSASLVNPNLPSNAVVGIKVTSKYDNSAGLATRFDYYAFEVGVNDGVTDAPTFYTDIDNKKADMISIEAGTGTPTAVFLFKDISATGKLSRGHRYYFTGRVYIGDHDNYFPDSYAGNIQPVMKSIQENVPFIAPSFKFLQYSSDGAGSLTYYYWIQAADPRALSTTFDVVGGDATDNTIVYSAFGTEMGTLTINNISNRNDVVVSCSVRSYEGESGIVREVMKQAYEYEAGFENFVYTLDNDSTTNRLKFTVRATDNDVSKEPVSRLAAIRVRLWKKDDESTAKEFLLPIDVATTETATAYLNYSSISDFVGDQIVGGVVALYDSKVSGFKLLEGSGTATVAIQTVPENSSTGARYITLDSSHSNITVGDSLAWNSLFSVEKTSEIEREYQASGYYAIVSNYTSLVDPKYNTGVDKKKLEFRPQMRGTVVTGPETVVTVKDIKEKSLSCLVSEGVTETTFETNISNALPTIDLWLGNSYNIVTKPEGATVYWSIQGHDRLIKDGQIRDNKMYLELYEVQNGSRVTLIGENGATSGNGISYTFFDPETLLDITSMSEEQNSYAFEITGLSPNKTYAIHFYYLDPNNTIEAATKHYPLDYKYSDADRFYSFATLDSVVLTPINNTAIYRANTYTAKNLEISYVPSTTSGFQVRYDFVRRTGADTYETILTAEQLRQKGIVDNTTLITEPTMVNLKFSPGLFQWIDGTTDNQVNFQFGSEDYFLLMTPVSTVDESISLGSSVPISLNIAEPNEPFYNVVATPGNGQVKFRIAVTDSQEVIYNNTYMVVVKDKEGNVLTSADGVDGLRASYSSKATYVITAKNLAPTDSVTLEIYAVTDMENIGTAPDIDTSNIDHRVKWITAQPLGENKNYALGDMSILSAGGKKANLYFSNSVGLDEAGCPIANVIYSVTQLNDNSSRTYSDSFVVKTDSDDIKYIELLPTFESNVWYSVYIKFLGADGKPLDETTLSYKG